MGQGPPRHDGLDGLRAVAVALVVAYHLEVPGFGGGFVGVDVFFAVSGYLITALLLREHDRSGAVALGSFWARRARRLYPLSWLVLAGVAVAGVVGVWAPDAQRQLPAATAAAFAQVSNWWQAANGGYVQAFSAPSPLRHYWSLSIEEQFYLVWPLLVVVAARVARRRGSPVGRAVGVTAAALAVASVGAGFVVDAQRAYLSTLTRAVGLLVGALLAVAWARWPLAGPSSRTARRWWTVAGATGATALVWVVANAHPEDAWLGHGGFGAVALASTAVVAAAVVTGPVGTALSAGPLVWLGRRSYAVYLLHWPVIVALGPGRPLWMRSSVTVAVSLAGAWVLYKAVERPVIDRRVRDRVLAVWALPVVAVAVVALVAGVPDGPTPSEQVRDTLGKVADPDQDLGASSGKDKGAGPSTTLPPCRSVAPPTTFGSDTAFDMATIGEVADPDEVACSGAVRVMVVGDSMARGTANGLAALGDARIKVWDRSVLGCSFNEWNYGKRCPAWRDTWPLGLMDTRPDVVVMYTTAHGELQYVDEAPYLSDQAGAARTAQMVDAIRLLQSGGAKVVVTTVPVPRRPNGLFYCKGKATGSRCDPEWVAAWNRSLVDAAGATGATVVDFAGWLGARGASATTDRPDGLHLSGRALVEHSQWLVPQLVTAAGPPAG